MPTPKSPYGPFMVNHSTVKLGRVTNPQQIASINKSWLFLLSSSTLLEKKKGWI